MLSLVLDLFCFLFLVVLPEVPFEFTTTFPANKVNERHFLPLRSAPLFKADWGMSKL